MTNRIADAKSKHDLNDDVAKDLERRGERRHRRTVASRFEELQQIVERTLIEGGDHCLGDIRKEVIDAEARTGEWVHPIVFEQAANDELHKKIGKVAHMDMILMEPEGHAGGAPVDGHAHQSEESDTA